jgi:hypothetical protein
MEFRRAIINEDYSSEYAKKYMEFVKAGGASAANPMQTLEDQIAGIDEPDQGLGQGRASPLYEEEPQASLKSLGRI